MKTYKEFLFEGRVSTDTLFHATSEYGAIQILKSNEFRLVPEIAVGADQLLGKKKRIWYLSTTRHVLGGFHKDNINGVIFNLNGSRIADNNKIVAVDYWGPDWYKEPEGRTKHEGEDRVLSSKPKLEPATRFIKSIHVNLDGFPNKMDDRRKKRIRELLLIAKKHSLLIYFYDDRRMWLTQKKPIKLNLELLKRDDKSDATYSLRRRDKSLGGLIEILVAPKRTAPGKFSEHGKKWLDRVRYYPMDVMPQMKASFHNGKKSPEMVKLVQLMHKHKLYNQEDLNNYLTKKWTK